MLAKEPHMSAKDSQSSTRTHLIANRVGKKAI